MKLINCEECNHLMSDEGKICPNCSAPRKVKSSNQPTNSSKPKARKMPVRPKQNTSQPILYILIGCILMYVALTYLAPKDQENKHYARVSKLNDLYVYINATPIDQSQYISLGVLSGTDIDEIWDSFGIGKDKFGQVILNIFNTNKEHLTFSKVIEKITLKAKKDYPNASGIIISNKLSSCEVIQFK